MRSKDLLNIKRKLNFESIEVNYSIWNLRKNAAFAVLKHFWASLLLAALYKIITDDQELQYMFWNWSNVILEKWMELSVE